MTMSGLARDRQACHDDIVRGRHYQEAPDVVRHCLTLSGIEMFVVSASYQIGDPWGNGNRTLCVFTPKVSLAKIASFFNVA